jgi:hypothetical protein
MRSIPRKAAATAHSFGRASTAGQSEEQARSPEGTQVTIDDGHEYCHAGQGCIEPQEHVQTALVKDERVQRRCAGERSDGRQAREQRHDERDEARGDPRRVPDRHVLSQPGVEQRAKQKAERASRPQPGPARDEPDPERARRQV